MAKNKSVPRAEAAFDVHLRNLLSYTEMKCSGTPPAWTHIPPQARSALGGHYTAWHTAYEVTLVPCTSPQRAEKNRLHKVADRAERDFINIYLRFHPDVTEDDKRNVGVIVPDTTRTPVDVPEAGPVFIIVQLGPRRLGINYQFGQGRKGSKPPGIRGARIYYGVFDEMPDGEEMKFPASVWATRCPHSITFRESDRGKRAWFALKWEAERGGEKGESGWSELGSEIIP
ncbi:MAG: hypothetical protein LBF78_10475 [Treponema sp.]|jgi:hypothetical protein|nr:hypothetical protein [Treponema sp.]